MLSRWTIAIVWHVHCTQLLHVLLAGTAAEQACTHHTRFYCIATLYRYPISLPYTPSITQLFALVTTLKEASHTQRPHACRHCLTLTACLQDVQYLSRLPAPNPLRPTNFDHVDHSLTKV
jgi:hypothetical protein